MTFLLICHTVNSTLTQLESKTVVQGGHNRYQKETLTIYSVVEVLCNSKTTSVKIQICVYKRPRTQRHQER